jgi:hypothetical protein
MTLTVLFSVPAAPLSLQRLDAQRPVRHVRPGAALPCWDALEWWSKRWRHPAARQQHYSNRTQGRCGLLRCSARRGTTVIGVINFISGHSMQILVQQLTERRPAYACDSGGVAARQSCCTCSCWDDYGRPVRLSTQQLDFWRRSRRSRWSDRSDSHWCQQVSGKRSIAVYVVT